MDTVATIQPQELADIIRCKSEKFLIVDARTFCEYNTSHIINSVNVWSSKIRKKRLQQNSISVHDFLQQACHISFEEMNFEEVIVYDQSATIPHNVPPDTFLYVLLLKLSSAFSKIFLLQGGFLEFQSQFYEMCEDSSQKSFLLTSFSQPCLPVSNAGPTKILPFLFLGSQYDANNKQLLLEHNISYELNVSTTCPKPDFLQDSHFFRIAVNDNFSAKLLPHFGDAFTFIDKVREVGGRVLVHCLAGISRSPTVVISYVMKYLHLHYDEAYRYVKTRRPTISPNINFVGQLLEFDLHMFGNSALFRSHPDPLYLPLEHEDSLMGSSSPGSSLLLKSSSSSCLGSTEETGFPYQLNRSLPSLRMSKSGPDVPSLRSRQCLLPPSSDLETFLSSFGMGGERSWKYVSDKLPSSPLSRPGTPDFLFPVYDEANVVANKFLNSATRYQDDITIESHSTVEETSKESKRGGVQCNHRDSATVAEKTCIDSNFPSNIFDAEGKTRQNSHHECALNETTQEKSSTHSCITIPIQELHLDDEETKPNNVALAMQETNIKFKKQTEPNLLSQACSQAENVLEVDVRPKSETKNAILPETKSKEPGEELNGSTDRIEVDMEATVVPQSTSEGTHRMESGGTVPSEPDASKLEGTVQPITKPADALQPDNVSDARKCLPPLVSSSPQCNVRNNAEPSSPDNPNAGETPPTFNKGLRSPRKLEPSQLPRSHSSSETYINTRRRLERQAASHPGGSAHTRKSFSSDEVGRGFQGVTGNSTPTSVGPSGPHKESFTSPLELARCDSWSTSGLGSEISDWDSLQEDAQSVLMEDTQGPFDAVFAEVFPGDGPNPSSSTSTLRRNSERRARTDEGRDKKWAKAKTLSLEVKGSDDLGGLAGRSNFASSPEDASASGHTPRPVSLPGVSGNYHLTDPNVNVDMGVGMEEVGEWQKEGVQIFNFPPLVGPKGQNLIEHPPVNPRTMGDDVKYIMTWYKIDSCRQPTQGSKSKPPKEAKDLDPFPTKPSNESTAEPRRSTSLPNADELIKEKEVVDRDGKPKDVRQCRLSDDCCESFLSNKFRFAFNSNRSDKVESRLSKDRLPPLTKSKTLSGDFFGAKRETSCVGDDKTFIARKNLKREEASLVEERRPKCGGSEFFLERKLSRSDKSETLHERWQKWDEEFKKKIKNIKKSVSLTSWDPSLSEESEGPQERETASHSNMAGFHLAQELMQSMEDLLEREISDIKRQANALSTRFSLPIKSNSTRIHSPVSPRNEYISPGYSKEEKEIRAPNKPSEWESSEGTIPNLPQGKSCSLPYVCPETSDYFACPSSRSLWKSNGLKEPCVLLANPQSLGVRAKSEPPMGMEESLYRVKSCPGIAQGKGIEDSRPMTKGSGINFRFPHPFLSGTGSSKRYSCSALDYPPKSRPSFESLPDMRKLSPFVRDSGPASAGPSPASSFNRLLKVS